MNVRTRRWVANLVAFAVAAGAGVVLRFPPASSGFYPRCPIFFWLHLYCPGCGGTRALASLLHGRLNEAIHWNVMVVLFFPFAFVFLALTYRRAMGASTFLWPTVPNSILKGSLVLITIFAVVRNLAPLERELSPQLKCLTQTPAEEVDVGIAKHGFVVAIDKDHLDTAIHDVFPTQSFIRARKLRDIQSAEQPDFSGIPGRRIVLYCGHTSPGIVEHSVRQGKSEEPLQA
jgi:hypothetical protein